MNLKEKVEIHSTQNLSIANFSGKSRFIIVEESVSAHCCFSYTIIDTLDGIESYGNYWKNSICETFNKESAVMVCRALNQSFA